MASSILVIDLGTSSAKAVLFSRQGAVLADSEVAYDVNILDSDRHEQDPEIWWTAAVEASQQVTPGHEIAAISLSGTMQSVIPVDAVGSAIRPAILYSDARATREFQDFCSQHELTCAANTLGNQPNALLACFKMQWLLQNERRVFEKAITLHSGAKDFVLQRFTGKRFTDPTAATTVGLMDQRHRQWSTSLCSALDVPVSKLPDIKPADTIAGTLLPEAARILGVSGDVPVFVGAGDAGAATLGSGISGAGSTYVYVGTTAWVAQIADSASMTAADGLYALSHPVESSVIKIGAMLSGGDSAAWCREVTGKSFEDLDALLPGVDKNPPSAMFLPYLKGERSPFNDLNVRGAFHFLSRDHGAADMFYSALEGIAFAVRANLKALDTNAGAIRLIGGGAISPLLPQLIADACDAPIEVASMPTAATAYGAFLLTKDTLDLSVETFGAARRFIPRPDRRPRAEKRYEVFEMLTQHARDVADKVQL